ncbi:MAG TPA: ABC transporter ATP-binding protein [Victivallales bacterium]|nr:ABC transporter ATP-binding protein [Victivallales bacterium]HPO91255.1 ABC transporter ATP-binding protein [Victivallales bacterium]
MKHFRVKNNFNEDIPSEISLKLFWRIFKYTAPYARKRNILFILVILRSIQLLVITWMIGKIINGPISSGNFRDILLSVIGFFAFVIFTQFCFIFRSKLAMELGESVIFDLRKEVLEHLAEMRMSYFTKTKVGRIISRFTSDAEALRSGIQNVVFVSLVQFGGMLVASILMCYYDWQLFMCVLALGPVVLLLDRYFRKRLMKAYRDVQESFSRVTSNVVESIRGIKVVQGFSREKLNSKQFSKLVDTHADYNIKVAENESVFLPLLELNSQVFIAILLLIAGIRVHNGTLELSTLIQFFFLSNFFFSPINVIAGQFNMALTAIAGAERLFNFLDEKPDWVDRPTATYIEIKGKVEFKKVNFSYKKGTPILKDISFSAEPGMTIALVGHTGSGKSTITNLIAKFYLPDSGEILIDGKNILDIQTSCIRKKMGIVLQSNFLFNGSVMENILLGKENSSENDAIEAAEKLECRDIIEALPEGFNTIVGENGVGLSLGQRQIICFCRAMLANPKIFILDEATSSVDSITEEKIQNALSKLLKDRTSFVIAHRLSIVRKADLILMMENGEIVERGNHHQLLKQRGKYAKLYREFQLAK